MASFQKEDSFVIPEGNFYFHGTTLSSAKSLLEGKPVKPIYEQMVEECAKFGADIEDLKQNTEVWPFFRDYILGKDRDQVLYVTNRFAKARSYATAAPEWRWHLTKWLHHPQDFAVFNSPIDYEEWYFDRHKADVPVVLVIKDPAQVPEPDDALHRLTYSGGEFKLPFPLANDIEILHVVEVSRQENQ